MYQICIYTKEEEFANNIRSIIQDYLIDHKLMGKVSCFDDTEAIILEPNRYDVYLIDMAPKPASAISLGGQMKKIDNGSRVIYLGLNENHLHMANKAHGDYYLSRPIDKLELAAVLNEIRQRIKLENIIVPTPLGARRVRVDMVNYIDIEKRCLCYHTTSGQLFNGQVLRNSFAKAITPLEDHELFVFIHPSLLINIGNIKVLDTDHLIFENDEVLYFPKSAYKTIHEKWSRCGIIING